MHGTNVKIKEKRNLESWICYEIQGQLRSKVFFGAFGSGKRLCHSHVRPSVRMHPVEIHWGVIDEIYLPIAIQIKTSGNSRHF
jgi:hypothetical protein